MIETIKFEEINHFLPLELLYPAQHYVEQLNESYTYKHWHQTLCGTYYAVPLKIGEEYHEMTKFIERFIPEITIYTVYLEDYNAYLCMLKTDDFNRWKMQAGVESNQIHELTINSPEIKANVTELQEYADIRDFLAIDMIVDNLPLPDANITMPMSTTSTTTSLENPTSSPTSMMWPIASHELGLETPHIWRNDCIIELQYETIKKYFTPHFFDFTPKNSKNVWHETVGGDYFATRAKGDREIKREGNYIRDMTPENSAIYICNIEGLNSCIYLLEAKVFFESKLFGELESKSIHYSATLSSHERSLQHYYFSSVNKQQQPINYIQFHQINYNNGQLKKTLENSYVDNYSILQYRDKKTWYEITISNVVYYGTIISGEHRLKELNKLSAQWKKFSKERIELRVCLTSYSKIELILLEQSYFNCYKTEYNTDIETIVKLHTNMQNTFTSTTNSEPAFNADLQTTFRPLKKQKTFTEERPSTMTTPMMPISRHELDLEPGIWLNHHMIEHKAEIILKYLPPDLINFVGIVSRNSINAWYETVGGDFFATFAKKNYIVNLIPHNSTIYSCNLELSNTCIYLLKANDFLASKLFAMLENESIKYYAKLSPWEMPLQHKVVSFVANYDQFISYIQFHQINYNNEQLKTDLKTNKLNSNKKSKTWYEITINDVMYYATIISRADRQGELSKLLAQWKKQSKKRIELRVGLTSYHDKELMLLEQSYFNVYKTAYDAIIEKVVKLPAIKENTFANTGSSEIEFNSDLQTYLSTQHFSTQHSLFSQPRYTSSSTSMTSSNAPDSLQTLTIPKPLRSLQSPNAKTP